MKKTLLFCGALLALTASMAQAQGINFAWGVGCWADNAVSARTFACNLNTGTNTMTGSFTTAQAIPDFVGIEVVVDMQSTTAQLPDWWQFFNPGSCRSTSLSANADFTTAPGGCADPFFGLAGGGIGAYQNPPVPAPALDAQARARLKIFFAVADPSPIDGGTEYYGFKATFNNQRTVGTGLCGGCPTGVTIVLNEIKAAGQLGYNERLNNAMANQCLGWNGGTSTVPCAATPTNNKTWGQVKSLYRD